jgi:ABC-type amino acid transport substrate-binding protein
MRAAPIIASVLVVAGLAALSPADDLHAIKKRGTLRVLMVPPPPDDEVFWSVAVASPGSSPGFEREMVEKFAGAHALTVEVVLQKNWSDLVPALQAGRGDMVAGRFTDTEARRKHVNFTSEVFPTRHVAVTLKPHRVVTAIEELRSEKIGTIRGTSLEEAIQAAGVSGANVNNTLAPGTLLQALKAGKATCIVWGIDQAIPSQQREPNVQIGVFVGPPGRLAWGVPKDAPDLLLELNRFLAAHRAAEWSKLVVKYFGPSAPELLRKARGD